MFDLQAFQDLCLEAAEAGGWNEGIRFKVDGAGIKQVHPVDFSSKLNLVHDELDEADEVLAHYILSDGGKPIGKVVEYADAVIRLLHLAALSEFQPHLYPNLEDDISDTMTHHWHVSWITRGVTKVGTRAPRVARSLYVAIKKIQLCADSCGYAEPLFWKIARQKLEFNKTRGHRHGGSTI
jgi:hypothetical protein